jgi:ketosteroid isomerase-like protein
MAEANQETCIAEVLRRLDHLESREEIRTLIDRYAVLVDARDIDRLLELYVEDYPVGCQTGKEALRASFQQTLGDNGIFVTTVHFVGQAEIEIDRDNQDQAHGIVYCRAEHEFLDGRWVIATLQYWDSYARHAGRWLFASREMKAFYVADVLERPNGPDRVKAQVTDIGLLGRSEIPEAWPSWQRFWDAIGPVGRLGR